MKKEKPPINKAAFKNLGNGECIFQDLDGRIGKLKFDAVFQDLIDVFSTTPKTKSSESEKILETEPEEFLYEDGATEPDDTQNETLPEEEMVQENEERNEPETYDFEYDDEALYRKEVL